MKKKIDLIKNRVTEIQEMSETAEIDINSHIDEILTKIEDVKTTEYVNMKPWDKVMLARHSERPTSKELMDLIFTDFIELAGDRLFKDDKSVIGGVGYLGDNAVTVIAQQKGKTTEEKIIHNFGMPHPEGYRKALRLMKQAEKFNRPIITFIDTPGAYPGLGAEERGQGEAIAKNLLEMSQLKVPIIAVIISEGGSGGALALGVADKILMLDNAVYSILSPEGFASILWKDAAKAKEAANIMKLTADELKELGVIDEVINEPIGGAHVDIDFVANSLKNNLLEKIVELSSNNTNDLLESRYEKFRNFGSY